MPKSKKKNQGEHILEKVINNSKINWFPGHMLKATREIKEKMKLVDIILEIRDARAPMASGNPDLKNTIGQKRRLIVVNKTNLADPDKTQLWEKWFEQNEENFVFINSLDVNSLKKIQAKAKSMLPDKKSAIRLMMVGLPNTGKSTIINRMAGRNAAKSGNKPGLTQNQQWIRLGQDFELLDTPGVMPRNIEDENEGLWLCAIHAIRDEILGEEEVACFIIGHLLKEKSPFLEQKYNLKGFNYSVGEAIHEITLFRNFLRKGGLPDYDRIYTVILSDFRSGDLGPCTFEVPAL
ncbi:ribosome biogenesis GTP-binding protein YlqF [Bacteriovorax sp. BSW11_IV]|uniref:ribosome biogenesis GTPase YlqF n=1 Tax=Bacteriovorax sp. BSW11_IV TaxID=1353529 RepID=UPI000389F862|nr:ribosome biogenesis GTPase YlqF [Bacteriovorax sp. BSW11_IV]EQC48672.1 ribosome biogenesis GTP-binding protein YlqF [Bacteriovorax sp. BSW11_IV]